MKKIFGFVVLVSAFGAGTQARAQAKSPTFVPVPAETADVQAVSEPKGMSLGAYVNSLLPTTKPFENQRGGEEFRFQMATAAGAEIGYTLSKRFELGLDLGYEHFSTRAKTGGGTILEFQKVKYWQIPAVAIVRYKFMNEDISPEIEAGAGFSYGKVQIGSTNLAAKPVEDTLMGYRAHASAGLGVAWTESSSVHASLGYAYYHYADKIYSDTLISVSQTAASGVFIKTVLRYKF